MKPAGTLFMKWLLLALVPVAAVYFISQWAFTPAFEPGHWWEVPGDQVVPGVVIGLLVLTVVFLCELAKPVGTHGRTVMRGAVLGLIFGVLFLAPNFSRYLWTEISTVAGWPTKEEPTFHTDRVCRLGTRTIRQGMRATDEEKEQFAYLSLGFHLEKEPMGEEISEAGPCTVTARIQKEYGEDHPVLAIWQGTVQITHDRLVLVEPFDTSEMADALKDPLDETFRGILSDPAARDSLKGNLAEGWASGRSTWSESAYDRASELGSLDHSIVPGVRFSGRTGGLGRSGGSGPLIPAAMTGIWVTNALGWLLAAFCVAAIMRWHGRPLPKRVEVETDTRFAAVVQR